jgi:hypothetical protein
MANLAHKQWNNTDLHNINTIPQEVKEVST